jgi:hypothetical protein
VIERSFDPVLLRQALDICPDLNPPDFDCEGWLANHQNLMFREGDNVGLLSFEYPGVYTGHYFFRCHGKIALKLAREIVEIAIEDYNAKVFRGLTKTSKEYRHARAFNRWLGMKSLGLIMLPQGEHELFIMTAEDFLERNN